MDKNKGQENAARTEVSEVRKSVPESGNRKNLDDRNSRRDKKFAEKTVQVNQAQRNTIKSSEFNIKTQIMLRGKPDKRISRN